MKPIEALTAEDLNSIRSYIQMYGGYGGDSAHVAVDTPYLLRYWNDNKYFLFDLFQHKLVHEKHVEINMPEALIMEDMEVAIWPRGDRHPFIGQFNTWCFEYAEKNVTLEEYWELESLYAIRYLVANAYTGTMTITIPLRDKAHPLVISKGMKLMKAFSKIVKEFPTYFKMADFEDFRIRHSMVLNQTKFKGTVGISIHPLDYMTMSDNDYSWDSCMSWQKPGEYRMGTVEMMNSDCVVVAYLRGDKDMDCGCGLIWNNKRWRKLFVVDPDIVLGIKGYPYNDKGLEAVVFDMLLELGKGKTSWMPEVRTYDFEAEENFIGGKNICIVPLFGAMYDDFYAEHPMVTAASIPEERLIARDRGEGRFIYNFEITISGQTECMCCGDNLSSDVGDLNASALMCPECSGMIRCDSCGEDFFEGEMVELSDGSMMCQCCYEYYARNCDVCGGAYNRDDVNTVYMEHLGQIQTHDNICVCSNCLNNTTYVPKLFGDFRFRERQWRRPEITIDSRNVSDEGFSIFGYYSQEDIDDFRREIAEADAENEES